MKNSFRIVNLDKLTNAFQVFSFLSKSQWKKHARKFWWISYIFYFVSRFQKKWAVTEINFLFCQMKLRFCLNTLSQNRKSGIYNYSLKSVEQLIEVKWKIRCRAMKNLLEFCADKLQRARRRTRKKKSRIMSTLNEKRDNPTFFPSHFSCKCANVWHCKLSTNSSWKITT